MEVEKELIKILKKLEEEGRIEEYNRLKNILADENIEIVDVLYKDDRVEVFCNDNFEEVPFVEIFFFSNSSEKRR